MRLLFVEDEKTLSDTVVQYLERETYIVDAVYDGMSAIDFIRTNLYDLVIMDVTLPLLDGFSVLKTIRAEKNTVPIILLTALSQTTDLIQGFNLGADDYVKKPFDIKELIIRIKARTSMGKIENINLLSFEDLTLNKNTMHLSSNERSIKLGKKEFNLIEYFLTNPGQILAREMLISKTWGLCDSSDYNNIEVYISFLRKKLRFLNSTVQIKTTKGVGYSLEKEASAFD